MLNLAEDPKAVASFQALKELLMSPQLLAYPNFDSSKLFIVDTDYSHDGIGTVLSRTVLRDLSPLMLGDYNPVSPNMLRLTHLCREFRKWSHFHETSNT